MSDRIQPPPHEPTSRTCYPTNGGREAHPRKAYPQPDTRTSDMLVAMSRCLARARSTGTQCGNRAITGMTVCYMHGGKSPAAKAAAGRRLAEAEVRRTLAAYGVVEVEDPIRALVQIVNDAVTFYGFVRSHVADLDVETWTSGDGSLNEYVKLLERAQVQAQRFLSEWVRLGLEERLVKLSERQADAIGQVIDGVLNAHPEPVQSKKHLGQPATVVHRQGSPVLVAVR